MRNICLTVEADYDNSRIDAFLSEHLEELSRSYVQKLIKNGGVLVGQKPVRASFRVKEGDRVILSLPDEREPDIQPEDIPLDILYEDEDLLVVNKPKGMVVHPAPGHMEHTLVNALLYHCRGSLSGINGVLRPGIVHRIDRDTTGALVVCKNDRTHRALAEQMAVHSIHRKYRAIVHGCFRDDRLPQVVRPKERPFLSCEWEAGAGQNGKELRFCIRGNIGRDKNDRKKMTVVDAASGKPAVTHVTVLRTMKEYSYIECELETGRTHQIRVHMAHIGHPVLGDPVYGPARCPVKGLEGQTLHAMTLGFIHPGTGKYLECSAELPEYFQKLLKTLP